MPTYTLRDKQPLFVREIGRGEPVVLLHGLALDSLSWLPFAGLHLNNRRFYIPDQRGWGKSRHLPIGDHYIAQMADDIHDLILKIGVPKVTLVGLSMGGLIGLEYLKRHGGDRINRYMHIDAPAHLIREDNPRVVTPDLIDTGLKMLEEARYFDRNTPLTRLPASYQRMHHKMIFGVLRNSLKMPWQRALALSVEYNPLLRNNIARFTSQGCWFSVLKLIESIDDNQYDTREALPSIDIPVTNLVGTHDTLFPLEETTAVTDLMPGAHTEVFEDSGHLLMVTESSKFARHWRDFLS
ncbi:MAG: alpha/beta fold hydrolase [Pseudomonadota bacterium]